MNTWLLSLAWRSAWNRRFSLTFTVISVALATIMLLGLERVRHDLRSHFVSAVSGTDLIVGARGGQLPLLLYTVFHVGSPTNTLKWASVEAIARQPGVAWVVPIAKGDSHRGFPVIGTTPDYFTHVRYGLRQPLTFQQGSPWQGPFDAVLGAEVAEKLGYGVTARLTLSHGDGGLNAISHDDHPFTVSGVLARTGTPVDRSILIGLPAMSALHSGWMAGRPLPGSANVDQRLPDSLQSTTINAALVGLERRAAVFSLQRYINTFTAEPLMGILPGVTLDELWGLLTPIESILKVMGWLIAAVSLAGLMSVILTSLNERRRELAVLRSVGARPAHIVALVSAESVLVTLAGLVTGILLLIAMIVTTGPWLQTRTGITLSLSMPSPNEGVIALCIIAASLIAGLIPAWRAYVVTLSDGLSPTS